MVVETKETYQTITKPFIVSIPAENIDETERVIYEDMSPRDGFILLPDFKWSDPSNLESLYCLAIVHDRSLRSLRDLTGSHLKLLQNVRYLGAHVFSLSTNILPSARTFSGKAVLLDDVIYNLSVNGDHYKNATLSFVVGEMQHKPLFELYREKKII
ncbi:uncharacterized protein PITG_00288 [Phytophthora infestans T30-4]|uniref:Uncharacterized protein n=1 Tax=Phytophthora infestans (strain T30-4) TaxID=403677 RepID=D0MQF1_PHYIT|nr:uncharacterized protein PITG_00288 [Phytophthora infestans T30-4]EEY57720.1 conserved hypothetical protein [Phytophthora infestans T30-4]|eukprot:XP_002908906.1 conserved hypothetical protein [Phytophthora infestans T30-4]